MTLRMSNGFLRPGLTVSEKMSPTVVKSEPAATWGKERTSRSRGSSVDAAREALAGGADEWR